MTALRQILGTIAASVTAGGIYATFHVVADSADAVMWPATFAIATPVALLHALVLGLPAAWSLRRRGKLTLLNVLVAAFAIGAVPAPTAAILAMPSETPFPTAAAIIMVCGTLGLIGGGVWWIVSGASSNYALERTQEG